jgi:NAD(P)-dependent dehydrogenase (short-subunit alcohol dehydrogenase family)
MPRPRAPKTCRRRSSGLAQLDGHRILVTGAARGLGRVIAEQLCRDGAEVIVADALADEGARTAADLMAAGGKARFVAADLADPASITRMAAESGAIDGLVNNAAIATGIGGRTLDEIDIDVWDKVMAVNVRGTWLVTRACAPALAASGRGRIVNIASDTALWGAPRLLAYVASKGAVISMTRSLARELGPRGIGVACVAPGILKTQSTEYVPEERHKLYESGRAVPGPQGPEDITGTIAFLLTPAALTLTGQVLPVNNGFVFT